MLRTGVNLVTDELKIDYGPLYHSGPTFRMGKNPRPLKAGLQWKGGPCVDTVCPCGKSWHRCDTEFLYYLRCPSCDRVFMVGESVELVELTPEERASLERMRDETYRPRRPDYVPWKSMNGQEHNGPTLVLQDKTEVTVCPDCYEPWPECECPCLAEKVKQLDAKVKKYEVKLNQIRGRCARWERDRALDERDKIVAWLEDSSNYASPSHEAFSLAEKIKALEHLPEPLRKLKQDSDAMLSCAKAGIPPSMRCASCKAHDALGLDPEE